jgi:predicted kinase
MTPITPRTPQRMDAAMLTALLAPDNLSAIAQSLPLQPTVTLAQLRQLIPAPGAEPDWPALLAAFPPLLPLARTPQDAVYHGEGDVWTHTRHVVEHTLAQSGYATASAAERAVRFLAALLHDIAKPQTTRVDAQSGHIGQPGHSTRGAIDARILLWRCGLPFAEREAICRLIAVHQVPFYALRGHRAGKSPEFLLRKLSHETTLSLLADLAEADMRGRVCADAARVLDDIELFRELAREERCLTEPRAFANADTKVRYFRGEDVHPDYDYHPEPGSAVIVMSGLPASGKDTYVQRWHRELPVVSFDDARTELGLKHGDNEGAAAHHAIDKARALLRLRAPFVWNATHLSTQMRRKTLDLLHAYHAQVQLVYLEQPQELLLARNRRRDSSLRNADLLRMLLRWEPPLPSEAHAVDYRVDAS